MKTFNRLLLFILLSGFIPAAYAQKPVYIGKVNEVVATYQKQAAAITNNVLPNAKIIYQLPNNEQLILQLKSSKQEGTATYFFGNVFNKENSNFYLGIKGSAATGVVIMRKERKAFRFSSTPDGSVYITEDDIDKVICLGIPQYDANLENKPKRIPLAQPSQAATPAAAVPLLQSLPGAQAVVYLDFDGETVTNPWWNNGNTINAAPANLTEAEMAEVWKLMSEDFRPFQLNITTDVTVFNSAPVNRRMRVIFTPTNTAAPGAGGVAYIGSFTWGGTTNGETPCWVFNSGIKGAGEAGSHEVGHTVGLGHDGRTSPQEEYFQGQGSWAPIMGVGYYVPQVQWSKGEYPNANNTQDDLAIITTQNGFGYRADDYGNTTGTATALVRDANGNVSPANNKGIITTRTDVDYFSFNTTGGVVGFTVNPDPNYPNLDVYLTIRNAAGTILAAADPATMPATIVTNLSAGTYYLTVDGVAGALGANSDYASLGAYSVSTQTYCVPGYTTGCTDGDLINSFTFNTLANNNTGCSSGTATGYTVYSPSGTLTTTVSKGQSYTMTMQSGASWAQGFGVWIDYNGDKDFEDAGEFVYASPTASTSQFSTTVAIPNTAITGAVGMRVRCRYNATVAATEACATYEYGEAEDYTIVISDYCVPGYNTGCIEGDYINNFSFNTLVNNGSNCGSGTTAGYTIYAPTGTLTTAVKRGQTYNMTMQSGASLNQGFGVWIDYNGDKDFNDAGEFVYASPTASTSLYSTTVTIPVTAAIGNTAMRVRCRYNSTVASTEACATYTWGEAEDYTILITDYCVPVYTAGCGSGDLINNFTFNTLVNNSTACGSATATGYTIYAPTGTRTTTVSRGQSYSMTMQSGATWPQGFSVWIDYNGDKDFDDPGEFVYASPSASTSQFSTTVTIPATAALGTTGMRVRCKYNSTVAGTEACASFTYGEAEDYTITITNNTPTITASGPTTNLCPGTSVTLTSSPANSYSWNTGATTPSITVTQAGSYTVTTEGGTSAPTVVTYLACGKPTSLVRNNITSTSAKLSWTGVQCGVKYTVRYRKVNTNTWTKKTIAGTSSNITGLTPSTTYEWQVQTICVNTTPKTTSTFAKGTNFTTAATGIIAYSEDASMKSDMNADFDALLYPNPAISSATVRISGTANKVSIKLTDIAGKVLWQSEKVGAALVTIPVEKFASGVYMVVVSDGQQSKVLKLVKQ